MAELTKIEWADATWNPWMGCQKVSPGCDNCYMFRDMKAYGRDPDILTKSKTKFGEPLKWAEPKRIFTCSWSDFFIAGADQWREEAWDIIRRTPQHTYLILTKRPGRMKKWAREHGWLDNVWAGVSVENTAYLHRLEHIKDVPAPVIFASFEPLLEWIDLTSVLEPEPIFQWGIIGGESGPNARPMEIEWLDNMVKQMLAYGVSPFVKQVGSVHVERLTGKRGKLGGELEKFLPSDLWIRDVPHVETRSNGEGAEAQYQTRMI